MIQSQYNLRYIARVRRITRIALRDPRIVQARQLFDDARKVAGSHVSDDEIIRSDPKIYGPVRAVVDELWKARPGLWKVRRGSFGP